METYEERKAKRTKQYNENKGMKLRPCTACNGTGRERYRPEIKEDKW